MNDKTGFEADACVRDRQKGSRSGAMMHDLTMGTGSLISVEGLDGAGKSTIITALQAEIDDAVILREPGGTAISELMREILKGEQLSSQPVMMVDSTRAFIERELPFVRARSLREVLDQAMTGDRITISVTDEISAAEEVILFNIARAELMSNKIVPALTADKVVILDRFIDSTIAYQGYGRGLSPDSVRSICLRATQGQVPDLTIYIRVSPQTAFSRINGRGPADRIEAGGIEFFNRVADGFEIIAAGESRIQVIDGEAPAPEVAAAALAKLAEL